MNADQVRTLLIANTTGPFSLREERDYLGMSQVGRGACPRALALAMMGTRQSEHALMEYYGVVGYAFEAAVKERLFEEQAPLFRREVVADFDDRFKGHVDYVLKDGTLVEIKTVTWAAFCRLGEHVPHVPRWRDVGQVGLYAHHGRFTDAVIIYIPRDVDYDIYLRYIEARKRRNALEERYGIGHIPVRLWEDYLRLLGDFSVFLPIDFPALVCNVSAPEQRIEELNAIAREILAAVDGEQALPSCTCGQCVTPDRKDRR